MDEEIVIVETEQFRKRAIKLSEDVVEIVEEFLNPFKKKYEVHLRFYVNKEEYRALKELFEG